MSQIINFHGQTVEVRRVLLGDKERPVAFPMYTYVLFKRQTGIDFFSLNEGDNLSYEDTMCLYHCAMVVGGIVTGESFDIDFEPDFMIMCTEQVMFDLAGIKAQTDVQADDEAQNEKTDKEKNGQSRSRLKASKKPVAAK